MSSIHPVSRSRHENKRWKPAPTFAHARHSQFVPLIFSELSSAAACYPIAFAKDEHGAFSIGCLLGVQSGRNTWVDDDGTWLGRYIPLGLRTYPFLQIADKNGTKLLCIDESSGSISYSSSDFQFFADNGEPSAKLREIMAILGDIENGTPHANDLCACLDRHKLLTPWPLTIKLGNIEYPIRGLFRIDEEAMNALDGDVVLELFQNRALAMAYGHLLSLTQVQALAEKQQEQIDKKTPSKHDPLSLAGDYGNISIDKLL